MAEYIEREKIWSALNMACVPYNRAMAKAIESIPAVDARPVVRGKWKVSVHKTYYDVSCSVCGINSFFQVDGKDSVSYANFCPNCGADMREEN